jgi:hypothetical protein
LKALMASTISGSRLVQSCRPPFADIKRDPKLSDGLSPGGVRHHFFAAISLNIALLEGQNAMKFSVGFLFFSFLKSGPVQTAPP